MLDAEQIEGWASPVGAGALVAMLDDARKALALVDEIGAKLPRECQEQRACAAAAGAIGALIVAAAGAVAVPRLVRYRPMPMARLTASSTTPISTAHTTPWLCWSSSCVLMCAPKEMGAIV